jgi:chemotaxis protein methyltransferase WspC
MKLPPELAARLRRTYGLDDATLQGPGCLVAVHHRMRHAAMADEEEYLELVERSAQEFEAFVDELLVPESWFFRDRAPFDFLANWVQSVWRPREGDERLLRVLSVPCASGPEPYSIAMTLLDAGLPVKSFRVYAGDVSERNLVHARLGEYRPMAFRGKDAEGRRHHFETLPDGNLRVRENIRACVSFNRCNLLDPGSLAFAPSFDIIFCRNVLIYFCEDARRSVVGHLRQLLSDDGLFFVGHADGLSVLTGDFEPAGPSGAFCYRHREMLLPDPSAPLPARSARSPRRPAKKSAAHGVRSGAIPTGKGAGRSPGPGEAPAAAASDRLSPDPSAPVPEPVEVALARVARLADQGDLDAAREHCLSLLQRHPPSSDALFLLGQIEMASSRLAEAETCIRKALYLNPNHLDAIVQMALLAERRGAPQEAQRLRARARKLEEATHV